MKFKFNSINGVQVYNYDTNRLSSKELKNRIVKIQALYRGYILRKKLKRDTCGFSSNSIMKLLDGFIHYNRLIKELNKEHKNNCKTIRCQNFPSEISENIVRLYWKKHKRFNLNWGLHKCGDLSFNFNNIVKIIEVKGYSSDGPTSFGPKEKWDMIYFVDCKDYNSYNFKIYEIPLKNTSKEFRNINMSKEKTFGSISDENKRGELRACFEKNIMPQLENHCKLVFNGNIHELL
jgi:hypothetical protein